MTLYHGSNIEIFTIDLDKCRPWKDFGRGFYLTDIPDQAFRMAKRVARIYGGDPIVTYFEADMNEMLSSDMSILVFDKPDRAWATFVMNNRDRFYSDRTSSECNLQNQYDW